MNTTIKILTTIIFTFLLATTSQAITLHLSEFGGLPNDNIDDTHAVREAAEKLINSGGGTLIFPEGTTDINSEINFVTFGNYQSYLLTGDRGAYIRLNGNGNTDYFNFGNVNQAEFEGLIFYAPSNPVMNARRVISSSFVSQTKITNCSFFGIGASVALVNALNTDLIVDKTQFDGSAAALGVIYSKTARGVTVTNSTFIDYANFLDMYLSKTPGLQTGAWVNIESENPNFGANGQRVARIIDCRFDEGALKAVKIKNQQTAVISGINVNVSGIDGGAGVWLDNVKFAEIKYSSFGFPLSERPAIELFNNSYAEVTALTLNDGVFFLESDSTSNHLVRYCPDCQSNLVRTSKK